MGKEVYLDGFVPWPDRDVSRFRAAGYWEDRAFGEHIDEWVHNYGERAAVVYDGTEITYGEMDEKATKIASYLVEHGVQCYDRVIMQLSNTPDLVYAVYGCLKIGAIPVCSLPTHRWAEISVLADKSGAKAHVTHAGEFKDFDYESFADEIREAFTSIHTTIVSGKAENSRFDSITDIVEQDIDIQAARRRIEAQRPNPLNPAFFQLSGGTTGIPKIIPRTHNDYYYNAKCVANAVGFHDGSRVLLALPLMHNFAMVTGFLPVHLKGGTIVLSDSMAPEHILNTVSESKADTLMTVPVLIHRLLEIPEERRRQYSVDSLSRVLWGGNPIEPETQKEFRRVFSCDTDQTYGMAEGLICYTRPSDSLETKLMTQGRPVSEADDVKIVDAMGQEVGPGDIGECWVQGPYTIRGYFREPERNREAFTEDGYYKTGDLVQKDKGKNIRVVGRTKDCVSRGAEKINAEEVEGEILKFPLVKSVAVVGMPDKVMGERVCAFVVPENGGVFSLEELNVFLLVERKIAKFKIPERLEFLEALPITNVGKYEKKSLREKISRILDLEAQARG